VSQLDVVVELEKCCVALLPDGDFMKAETCSLVYDQYIYIYVVLDRHIQAHSYYNLPIRRTSGRSMHTL
jgi:hypothetical protein